MKAGVDCKHLMIEKVGHMFLSACTDDKPEGRIGTPGGDGKRKAFALVDQKLSEVYRR